eukprot:3935036-Rhodomonas_salina.2
MSGGGYLGAYFHLAGVIRTEKDQHHPTRQDSPVHEHHDYRRTSLGRWSAQDPTFRCPFSILGWFVTIT